MEQLLKASANALSDLYPALADEIYKGLLLALAGRIKPEDDAGHNTSKWQVSGGTVKDGQVNVYTVTATPVAWHCNCEGSSFKPYIELLDCRGQICKHICAAALCRPTRQYPPKPASAWEMFERMVRAQVMPLADTPVKLPGSSLVMFQPAAGQVALRYGRHRSAPLVEWRPFPNFPLAVKAGGMWHLLPSARRNYEALVEVIKNASNS